MTEGDGRVLCSRAPGPAPGRDFAQSHRHLVTQAPLCLCGTGGWGWDASTGVWPQTHSMVLHLSRPVPHVQCGPLASGDGAEPGSPCACPAGLRGGLAVLGVLSQPHAAAAACPGPTLRPHGGLVFLCSPLLGPSGPTPQGTVPAHIPAPQRPCRVAHLDRLPPSSSPACTQHTLLSGSCSLLPAALQGGL